MITNYDDAKAALDVMIADVQADYGDDFSDDMVSDLLASLSYDCDDATILELARRELGFYPGGARPVDPHMAPEADEWYHW